jgi:hypothetical protein
MNDSKVLRPTGAIGAAGYIMFLVALHLGKGEEVQ